MVIVPLEEGKFMSDNYDVCKIELTAISFS
jgi:hypothetical protein